MRRLQKLQEVTSPKNVAALNSARAVRKEMSKVYRAICNGRIAPDEGTRLVYVLEKVLRALESEAESAEIVSVPVPLNVQIISVPPDHQVRNGLVWPNVPAEGLALIEQLECMLTQAAAMPIAEAVEQPTVLPVNRAGVIAFPGPNRSPEVEDVDEPQPAA